MTTTKRRASVREEAKPKAAAGKGAPAKSAPPKEAKAPKAKETPKDAASVQAGVDPRLGGSAPAGATAGIRTVGAADPEARLRDAEEQVKPRKKDELVSVTVPQAFTLALTHQHKVRYEAGIQDMPRTHAQHKYSIANGVEVNE